MSPLLEKKVTYSTPTEFCRIVLRWLNLVGDNHIYSKVSEEFAILMRKKITLDVRKIEFFKQNWSKSPKIAKNVVFYQNWSKLPKTAKNWIFDQNCSESLKIGQNWFFDQNWSKSTKIAQNWVFFQNWSKSPKMEFF